MLANRTEITYDTLIMQYEHATWLLRMHARGFGSMNMHEQKHSIQKAQKVLDDFVDSVREDPRATGAKRMYTNLRTQFFTLFNREPIPLLRISHSTFQRGVQSTSSSTSSTSHSAPAITESDPPREAMVSQLIAPSSSSSSSSVSHSTFHQGVQSSSPTFHRESDAYATPDYDPFADIAYTSYMQSPQSSETSLNFYSRPTTSSYVPFTELGSPASTNSDFPEPPSYDPCYQKDGV